jgi:hypothetical protein
MGLHRAAAQGDVAAGDAALAVADQEFLAGIGRRDGRIDGSTTHRGWLSSRRSALCVIDPHQVFQLAPRRDMGVEARLPLRQAVTVHLEDRQRRIALRLLRLEDPTSRPLDEAAIVGVQAELHQVFGKVGLRQILVADAARPGGHVEPRLQVRLSCLNSIRALSRATSVQRCTSARLLPGIVDRLAVDGDAHQIEAKGIGRADLAGQAGDVHPFVVVEEWPARRRPPAPGPASIRLDEAGVDHVMDWT